MKQGRVYLSCLIVLFCVACEKKQVPNTKQDVNLNPGGCPEEVLIGKQVWMRNNLDVACFRNGDSIPQVITDADWMTFANAGKPAWCYYGNDPGKGAKYGKLYNWYAVNDQRGLAPKGWHIPSDTEWDVLANFLGGVDSAGVRMKSKTDWFNEGNGTNSSCFSAYPGGRRNTGGGVFGDLAYYGAWWSATEANIEYGKLRYISHFAGGLYSYSWYKGMGYSVRCIKD